MKDKVDELLAKDPPLLCVADGPGFALDAAEYVLFPPVAFARNPISQWKYYPFMGCFVLPRSYR